MNIAFCSAPSYLDTTIPLVNSLAKENNVSLIIEYQIKEAVSISSIENFTSKKIFSDNPDDIERFLGNDLIKLLNKKIKVYLLRYLSTKTMNPIKYLSPLRLIKFLYKLNPDVIDIQSLQLSFAMPLLNKFPQVITIHDPIPHTGERNAYGAELLKRLAIHYADQIIVHSKEARYNFSKKYNVSLNKINTIYLGTLTIFRNWIVNPIFEEAETILFFGRISPYKGIEYLVSAVPIVKKHIPDLKVIIAGNGKFYFDVERIRNDDTYEIINRYITNEELVELIQKSSLVICPYTDATQSGVIMTAYAFNKPVVASAVGGIPEVVEDGVTGRLVPPKNPQALATAIIDLLHNPQKREQMKKNIEKKCSEGKLSWDYIAKQTVEVYRKAIS